ncbi:hypothetical protein OSTOST_15652 [Ostertagia ostertagi]
MVQDLPEADQPEGCGTAAGEGMHQPSIDLRISQSSTHYIAQFSSSDMPGNDDARNLRPFVLLIMFLCEEGELSNFLKLLTMYSNGFPPAPHRRKDCTLPEAFDNYDKCFTDFFQKFIASNYRHKYAINPCDRLHQVYRECVEEKLATNRPFEIDIAEVQKDFLNTDGDKLRDSQEENLQSNLPHPQIISDSGESRFNQLERTLEQFQENARHLGVIATDFGARSQEPFNQKIHTLVSGLQELDQMRSQFMDVKVPLELLDVLDQGKNPQLYTKEVLERTLLKNKEVNAVMSIGANAVFRPQNSVSAALIRFVPNFVALRLSWTHNSLRSEGVEQFVDEFLPIIRENNPQIKYFPTQNLHGMYTWLRNRKKRASWRSKHQVLSMIEEMSVGGDYRPGMKRGVNRRLPRGQELWDTETLGHDVFKVYSKWKADEEDLDMPTSQKHPHFVYRKY